MKEMLATLPPSHLQKEMKKGRNPPIFHLLYVGNDFDQGRSLLLVEVLRSFVLCSSFSVLALLVRRPRDTILVVWFTATLAPRSDRP
jgi:hypothetical protein